MNVQRLAGFCRQYVGKFNQIWGELSGDLLRARAGRREQIIGKTQQISGLDRKNPRADWEIFGITIVTGISRGA